MADKILFADWVMKFNPDKLEWVYLFITERSVYVNGELVKEEKKWQKE